MWKLGDQYIKALSSYWPFTIDSITVGPRYAVDRSNTKSDITRSDRGIHDKAFLCEMAWNPSLTNQIIRNTLNAFSQFVIHT